MIGWNSHLAPPSSDYTVLMRLSDPKLPVWPGWYVNGSWQDCGGFEISSETVTGWMRLEDAAAKLDA